MKHITVSQEDQIKKDQAYLLELISSCLSEAKTLGASSAQVSASKDKGLVVNVRMAEVDTVEFTSDNGLTITVYYGQRCGVATTTELSKTAIRDALHAAATIAKSTAEDPYAGLADNQLMAHDYPDLNLCFPWQLDTLQAIEYAKACDKIGLDAQPQITNSDGTTLSTHHGVYAYGNSHGFSGTYPWSRHSVSCVLVAKDAAGRMQRDSDYTLSRDPKKLLSLENVAQSAAARTVQRLGARPIATCQVPVIFAAEVAGSLLGTFIAAISGGNLYRRTSFLVDAINQPIFPTRYSVIEDPLLQSGLASRPFDAEGVVTKKRELVQSGRLLDYVLSSYTARKLGLKTTGNAGGIHNLIFTHDDLTFTQLLNTMQTGLLVTDVMGNGINLTSGDYSQGASGFWVENGEIQYPVEGITIAGNLRQMFMNIRAIANDIDYRHSLLCGSILIDGMTIAGT